MNIDIQLICETTEYAVVPHKDYTKTVFVPNENSLVISFTNDLDEVLTQSEISKEDALKMAKIIQIFYENFK